MSTVSVVPIRELLKEILIIVVQRMDAAAWYENKNKNAKYSTIYVPGRPRLRYKTTSKNA